MDLYSIDYVSLESKWIHDREGVNMAYLGETIKKLGFGMMRLPQKDGKIDIEQTKKMVDLFMAAGFTYFDTA